MPDLEQSFWFCLAHDRPESYAESDSPNRLGPYATRSEAQDALKSVAARNERLDREDADWDAG